MLAFALKGFGGPQVLELTERPQPVPGPGDVLIQVSAFGINRPDVLQRSGHYPPPPGASDLPGLELSGLVLSGDAQALAVLAERGLNIGDRVCALVTGGAYAELAVAPAAQCLPIPAGLSDVQAASLPETFFTVWSNVFERGQLRAGESLLIHGGSSGIGVTAIQLAKARGAQVLVTAGSDEKCQACLQLGADVAINYKTQDFVAEVLMHTQQRGVDVILDMVAGDYVPRDIECLADDGRLLILALQGGAKAEVNLGALLRRRLTLTGSTLRPRPVAFKGAIAQGLLQQVWPLLAQGQIKPVIHQVFDGHLPQAAAQAHALMESSLHTGKLVVSWRGL